MAGPDDTPLPHSMVDLDRPNAARMYDYMLGGAHNFAVDRDKVAEVLARRPAMIRAAWVNRDFLARAVRWCLDRGVDQFLDLGSGVPTVGNVHEIAHQHTATARVVYVDVEPVAVAVATAVLDEVDNATVIQADLRDPAAILTAPAVTGLLDLHRPVALIAAAVLHFVPGDLRSIMAEYRAALCPGSVLVMSHGSDDVDDPDLAATVRAGAGGYRGSATQAVLRSRAELLDLLVGLELVPPGLVDQTDWPTAHPEEPPVGTYAVVATLPTT